MERRQIHKKDIFVKRITLYYLGNRKESKYKRVNAFIIFGFRRPLNREYSFLVIHKRSKSTYPGIIAAGIS